MSLPQGVRELLLTDLPPGTAVTLTDPDGIRTVPTFTGRDGRSRVRVRTHRAGDYAIDAGGETVLTWAVDCEQPPAGRLLHRSGRRLVDQHDVPFFWLADTWWFAFCDRISEAELRELARRRVRQGFSVVQVVAGLLPEVDPFDDLGELGGRWPWTPGFDDIDPRWWDDAERRLAILIEEGLTPAVVGGWSYYLLDLGPERMMRHWHEVVARWAAYPVVWCVAGEAGLPHYSQLDEPGLDEVVAGLSAGWRDIAAQVRTLDGYRNVSTVHPCPAFAHFSSTDAIGSADDLDLIWLQTGHADRSSIDDSLAALDRELAAPHGLPVINSEVCYEGIAAGSAATLQRFLFFSHLLSGAAGHSYGAQGLWAFRRAEDPGPGIMWGDATWQEAAALPGSAQLGRCAAFLQGFDWAVLVPAPDALTVHASAECRVLPYAARLGDELIAYVPAVSLLPADRGISQALRDVSLAGLTPGWWRVRYWNPRHEDVPHGFEHEVSEDGRLPLRAATRRSAVPSMEDWVVVVSPLG